MANNEGEYPRILAGQFHHHLYFTSNFVAKSIAMEALIEKQKIFLKLLQKILLTSYRNSSLKTLQETQQKQTILQNSFFPEILQKSGWKSSYKQKFGRKCLIQQRKNKQTHQKTKATKIKEKTKRNKLFHQKSNVKYTLLE